MGMRMRESAFGRKVLRLALAGLLLTAVTGCGEPSEEASPDVPGSFGGIAQDGGTESQNGYLTVAEAKASALENAGLTQEEVQFVRVQLDSKNGEPVYDVEFLCREAEYDYLVDAVTGEVRSMNCEWKEYDMDLVSREAVQVGDAQPEGGQQYVGNEAARQAALNHAGLSEVEVHFVHTRLEWDDGKWVYDVEFHRDNTEYDYEIDAVTGEVLSFDQEAEYAVSGSKHTAEDKLITEEQAKQVALERAGVDEKDVRNLEISFDHDDGRAEYEVEWHVGRTEYSCDVDAVTGEVLSFEREGYK